MRSCACDAVPRLAPLREPAVPDRCLVERADPFREFAVPLLDALVFARLVPFADPVLVVFAAARVVRGFGDCVRPFAELVLAELARDACFGAAAALERPAVLLRPPA
jgi:hypothetical protein